MITQVGNATERGSPPDWIVGDPPRVSQLKEHVYEQLRGAIVGLRLHPGQPLREAAVAQQLGVSKTPVREALVRLAQVGLVRIEAYKGAVVAGYDQADLREIYELRELLEGACARHAAEQRADGLIDELGRTVVDSGRALEQGDIPKVIELFDRFDTLLFQQLPNRRIRDLLGTLQDHLVRIGKLTVGIPGRLQASVDEHAAIHAAIRDGDGDGAERLLREHVRSVLHDQLDKMAH